MICSRDYHLSAYTLRGVAITWRENFGCTYIGVVATQNPVITVAVPWVKNQRSCLTSGPQFQSVITPRENDNLAITLSIEWSRMLKKSQYIIHLYLSSIFFIYLFSKQVYWLNCQVWTGNDIPWKQATHSYSLQTMCRTSDSTLHVQNT